MLLENDKSRVRSVVEQVLCLLFAVLLVTMPVTAADVGDPRPAAVDDESSTSSGVTNVAVPMLC